jgi:hypothetical protein
VQGGIEANRDETEDRNLISVEKTESAGEEELVTSLLYTCQSMQPHSDQACESYGRQRLG